MKSIMNRVAFAAPLILLAGASPVGFLAAGCGGTSEAPPISSGKSGDGGGSGSDGGGGVDTDGGGGGDTDGGSAAGQDSGSGAGEPTWTTIYATYFGAGTPGHCGNSSCHASTLKGFKCGADKTTCYTGLVTAGYITPSTPAKSPLADPNTSCLTWLGGNMPPGGGANAMAQKDLAAWAAAGALDN